MCRPLYVDEGTSGLLSAVEAELNRPAVHTFIDRGLLLNFAKMIPVLAHITVMYRDCHTIVVVTNHGVPVTTDQVIQKVLDELSWMKDI